VDQAVSAGRHRARVRDQVGDDIGFTTIAYQPNLDPLPAVCAAIDEILEQGEGASAQELVTSSAFETEESHYAKFASLYYGARYLPPIPPVKLTRDTESLFFRGGAIGAPEVINTLAVPSDRYAKILALDPDGAAVARDLEVFDGAFSSVLAALDAAWNGPVAISWKTLGGAVHNMVDLRVLSCFNILRHQIPPSIIAQLPGLYPGEHEHLRRYTNLSAPVFYGPRFVNTNTGARSSIT
jgi:hypothetical protein